MGVEGVGCGGGLGLYPEENHFFVLKMISLGAFDSFNRQKIRTVTRTLGTRILPFNRETKRTKIVQKISRNSRSDQKGRRLLNTPLGT